MIRISLGCWGLYSAFDVGVFLKYGFDSAGTCTDHGPTLRPIQTAETFTSHNTVGTSSITSVSAKGSPLQVLCRAPLDYPVHWN